jgi:hypothetical protein
MKSKDRQGEFNLNLMQSLERIERKLDKESESIKIGSRGSLRGKEDKEALAGIVVTP